MRNKEETKRKLIAAVAHIFREENYQRLGVNKVAQMAGVDKQLIYRYFGSFDGLIEAYIVETDYWMLFAGQLRDLNALNEEMDAKALIRQVLKNQFTHFFDSREMQAIIRWEIESKNPLMQSIHRTRENLGQYLLEITEPCLLSNKTDFRAIAALIVGGIYYMVLHSRVSGGMFCNINLNEEKGRKEILMSIDHILDLFFDSHEGK